MKNILKVSNYKGETVFTGDEEEVNEYVDENRDDLNKRGYKIQAYKVKFDRDLMDRTLNKFDLAALEAVKEMVDVKLNSYND